MIYSRIFRRGPFGRILPQVVFVLGTPGTGKGTQCQKIYGELLYKEGKIVPVDITCSLLERRMESSSSKNFLIDGFPRNKDNLDGFNRRLSEKVKLLLVLFFDCSLEICTDRCLARGAAGSGRSDDNLESLKKLFDTYANETKPIIDHYEKSNLVVRVDSNQSPDAVFDDVKKVFLTIGFKEAASSF